MYEARFTTKQVYDNYAKSVSKPKNANQQAARTMSSVGIGSLGGRTTRRDRNKGSTYDEVPQVLTQGIVQKPKAKPVKEKGYEKVIRVFNNAMERFGIFDEPTSTYDTVKPQNIYKSALFSVPEVTTTTLPDMAPAIAANFGLSMGVDPYDPRGRDQRRLPQNTYQSTINTIFTGGGRDEPVKGRFGNMYRPGLMSPPTMDQTKPETPGLTIEDAVNRAILATTKEYVIKPGDTLSKIARRNNTTVKELAEINKIEDVDVIKAGASLRVPKSTMTDTQAAIRRGYEREKPDEGIEVAYNPLALGLPSLVPDISLEDSIVTRLKAEEGFEDEAYKLAGEKEFTIGYGHYGSDVKEGDTITKKEAEALLRQDVRERMPQIKKAIPNFDNLSKELKVEIAQSWFRGGIAGSPKTIKLINEGKWEEASKEFLDNNEYRNTKLRGVKRRMRGLSNALKKEANK